MTAMAPHQSYMTQHSSLFTLISYYAIAFLFALMFRLLSAVFFVVLLLVG